MNKWIILVYVVFLSSVVFAQDEEVRPRDRFYSIDTPLTIDFDKEKEEEEENAKPRKKKKKKNVFYGLKTKKGFTKTGYGNNTVLELFYYLKEYREPDEYVQEIYWYDFKRKQIRKSKNINKQYGVILHGPYKKLRSGQAIDSGVFYIGTRHGRWMSYDRHGILINKRKYYKGWPRESLVRYYDNERTMLREVIPVVYGKKEGTYYYFFENGNIAVKGRYENNVKVGKWTEYYPFRNKRKKEIVYPNDPWDKITRPYILKEWNETGKVVYDHNLFIRNTTP